MNEHREDDTEPRTYTVPPENVREIHGSVYKRAEPELIKLENWRGISGKYQAKVIR